MSENLWSTPFCIAPVIPLSRDVRGCIAKYYDFHYICRLARRYLEKLCALRTRETKAPLMTVALIAAVLQGWTAAAQELWLTDIPQSGFLREATRRGHS